MSLPDSTCPLQAPKACLIDFRSSSALRPPPYISSTAARINDETERPVRAAAASRARRSSAVKEIWVRWMM
jgi:hypothetical protein